MTQETLNNHIKKTKIVCTIGPSSWPPEELKKMVDNGMNVARVNGAFADLPELERVEGLIKDASPDVALMLDIKGHEVRLNKFDEPIGIKVGQVIEIGNSEEHEIYPETFPNLYKDIPEGTVLIFDDGNVEALVREVTNDGVMKCEIVYGELFKPGKSINTPGIHLSNPSLTERDKDQIAFCKDRGWSFVAASFIRSKEDAEAVAKEVEGSHMKVIAKIEDQDGVDNLDAILDVVEGVMVARGDLGVEVPFERIPLIQKDIILKCNERGKPVITATQMLESMVEKVRPTRAEITDVANAIIDGTDAIMLSGESSTGKHPALAVGVMNRIAREIEPHLPPEIIYTKADAPEVTDALTKSAFQIAFELGEDLKAVIVVSLTGRTARLLGRFRLSQPIYAFVSEEAYRKRLMLSRGITKAFVFSESIEDRDKGIEEILEEVRKENLAETGDKILILGNGLTNSTFFPNIFEIIEVPE